MHNLVPRFILEQYAAGQRNGRFLATTLFIDISGFSIITDALMQQGQHGAEVLASVMNDVFDPLVQRVYEQGGFIAGFAGDAFTAIFPHAPLQALAAAWISQQYLRTHSDYDTAYGRFTMSAKVGAAMGEVAWGIITAGDGSRASYYFQGTAIDACAAAEKEAAVGDVILDAALYEQVQAKVRVEKVGQHWRLTAATVPLPLPQLVSLPPPDPELLSHFFPTAVTQRSTGGEFRQVVNLFMGLPTVRTEAQLSIFMQTVFALQEAYGGLLNRLDFGDKGAHLLLFWGAPITYENDVQRALHFILDLQTQTAIPFSCGVTYRIAHAGLIGSSLRSEYTCYGRGVNLAARFMTGAPRGEIWLDENTAARAQDQFDLEYEGERGFKGFTEPQKVYILFERKEAADRLYTGETFGREAELAQLAAFTAPIFEGRNAGLLIVWGEPGIGKSRLVHEFLGHLSSDIRRKESGVAIFLAQTDEILRQSLNPFRYWLKAYFSVSEAIVESRNKRSFNRKVDDLIARIEDKGMAKELDRTRSFLGALVGLRWPDSLYEQLDAKSRYENTLAGLVTLLQAESRQQPVIFSLEDVHWLDADSKAFIPRLLQNLADYPVAIVATSRFEGTGDPLEGFSYQEINLTGLTRTDLVAVAESKLGDAASESLVDLLVERAEGNPFFAEQILRHLQAEQQLEQAADGWYLPVPDRLLLPTDIHALLIARLDRLSQEIREVVQTAAVLGREFDVRLLSYMLQDDDTLPQKVVQAEQEAIWAALNEIRYIFRHALLREAAYRMQLRARRQALHALALHSLESLYAGNLAPYYGEMAYHALAARLHEPAFQYSLAAGDVAMDIFALPDALAHYENARQLLYEKKVGKVNTADEQHLYLQLGRALELNNQFDEAIANYQELAEIGEKRHDDALILASLTAQCIVYATQTPLHAPSQARKLGEQALLLARKLGDRPTEARVLWGLLLVEIWSGGDYQGALTYGEQSLTISRELNLKEQTAFTLTSFATLYFNLGQSELGLAALQEARPIWDELGNIPMLADAYNMAGWLHMFVGDYEAALIAAGEGISLSRSIGNVWNHAGTLVAMGGVYVERGEIERAVDILEQGKQMATEAGITYLRFAAYNYLILAYLTVGAVDRAEQLADELYAVRDTIVFNFRILGVGFVVQVKVSKGKLQQAEGILEEACDGLNIDKHAIYIFGPILLAEVKLQLALGKLGDARERLAYLIRRVRGASMLLYLPEALWLQGNVLLAMKKREKARQILREARTIAEEAGARRMLWQILGTSCELETAAGNATAARQHRQQALEIITYIADHAGSDELRKSFLNRKSVRQLVRDDR